MNPLDPGQQRPHPPHNNAPPRTGATNMTTPNANAPTIDVVVVLNDDTWKSVIHRVAHADITKLEAGTTP